MVPRKGNIMINRAIPKVIARRTEARHVDPAPRFEMLERRELLSIGFIRAVPAGGGSRYAIADFNADGFDDIASTGRVDMTMLHVAFSDGAGGFSGPLVMNEFFPSNINLAAADFDNDGDADILALGFRLFRNDGSGAFAAPETLSSDSLADWGGPTFFRYDADEFPDLVVWNTTNDEIRVYRNLGGTGLAMAVSIDMPARMRFVTAADMDADGIGDIVMRDDNGVVTYLADGDGGFTPAPRLEAVADAQVKVGDLNADGLPDLVWVNNGLLAALNVGAAEFQLFSPSPSGDPTISEVLDIADLNADGVGDLVCVRRVSSHENEAVVSLASEPGRFRSDTIFLRRSELTQIRAVTGRFADPGPRPDVLVAVFVPSISGTFGFSLSIDADGPVTSDFAGPGDPLIPGHLASFTLTAQGVDGRDIREVRIYHDADGDGVFNSVFDALVGSATRESSGSPAWDVPVLAPDGLVPGVHRFFAIAIDEADVRSDSIATEVTLWTRVFYPEGWRNDITINEYVPIVNPYGFPVEYQLVAHYETGDRDQVVAQGVIAAHSRSGVTTTEHRNPDAARVRLNEAYALELQSRVFLGATLSHYDWFSGGSGVGAATGEAFTNATSTTWSFADAFTADIAFLVFFNPLETGIEVTIHFYDEQGSLTTCEMHIDPLRRSGVALRNPDLGLLPNTHYAIEVASSSPVVAALSSYSTTDGSGFTALGLAPNPDGVAVFPLVEFRDQVQNRLTLFNSLGDQSAIATVRLTYPGTATPPTMLSYMLDPLERRVIDLDEMRPVDAIFATVRVEGIDVRSRVDSVDADRGDSVVATPASSAFTVWAFADGFLDRNTAGRTGLETLAIFNPSMTDADVRVRFLFSDGAFVDRNLTLSPGSTQRLRLDQELAILDHTQLNFYSMMVYSAMPTVASMIHWDLFQHGGWATLGTPGGTRGAS